MTEATEPADQGEPGDELVQPVAKPRRRSLIVFGYAHEDDEQWSALEVTSREMLAVERQVKGFSANAFFTNVSVEGLYRIAYVVLRVRGDLPAKTLYEDFVSTYDVKFGDPTQPADSDDQDSDDGSEVDPTIPTA